MGDDAHLDRKDSRGSGRSSPGSDRTAAMGLDVPTDDDVGSYFDNIAFEADLSDAESEAREAGPSSRGHTDQTSVTIHRDDPPAGPSGLFGPPSFALKGRFQRPTRHRGPKLFTAEVEANDDDIEEASDDFQDDDVFPEASASPVPELGQDYTQGSAFKTDKDSAEDPAAKTEVWWRKRKWQWVVVGVVGFLVVATAVIVPTVLLTMKDSSEDLPPGKDTWISCPANSNGGKREEEDCLVAGCSWRPSADPWPSCFLPEDSPSHYRVLQSSSQDSSLEVQLSRNSKVQLFGKPHDSVTVFLDCGHANMVTVRIVPDGVSVRNGSETWTPVNSSSLEYTVEVPSADGQDFSLRILRKSNNQLIWDSSLGGMILEAGFLQVASRLPSAHLYGMGQNAHGPGLRRNLDLKTWPLFNRDPATQEAKKLNLNSFHPFYLTLEENGAASGVLFRTLQASEYILLPAPGMVFRTIDQYLEFVVLVGDSPAHVVQMLSQLVGRAHLPPYWALGLHYYPKGHPNETITQIRKNNITLDAVQLSPSLWKKEMVLDTSKAEEFPDLNDYVQANQDLAWIITLSPALLASPDYGAFDSLREYKCLLSWRPEIPDDQRTYPPSLLPTPQHPDPLLYGTGKEPSAAGDYVAFANFDHPASELVLHALLEELRVQFPFKGIYTRSNSPTNMDTNSGQCLNKTTGSCWTLSCPDSQWEQPPYVTAAAWGHGESSKLSDGTVCMSGQHLVSGTSSEAHLSIHNFFGMRQALVSLSSCSTDNNRCLVLSESTAYSLDSEQRRAGAVVKFLDPVDSTWEALRRTLHDLLEFSLLGLPLVGADICGKDAEPEERLCVRWAQLGAFYPLLRLKQETDLLGSPSAVRALRDSLHFRYTYLEYTISALYLSQTSGDPLLSPLFYHFPADAKSRSAENQFMYGNVFMVAPVLEKASDRADAMDVHFPGDGWYRLQGNASDKMAPLSGPGTVRVDHIEDTPLFVRAGHILPCHRPKDSVRQTLDSSLILEIFPRSGQAKGFLYVDDGLRNNTIETGSYFLFDFTHDQCNLSISRRHWPNKPGFQEVKRSVHLAEVVVHDWEREVRPRADRYQHPKCRYYSNPTTLTCAVDIDLTEQPSQEDLNWLVNWEEEVGACHWPPLPVQEVPAPRREDVI